MHVPDPCFCSELKRRIKLLAECGTMGRQRRRVSFACFDKPDYNRETHRINHMLKNVTAAAAAICPHSEA